MRTLVLGIALPHTTFDNASFLSAPSLNEYHRVVVDLAAAARAVQDVVEGTAPHTTYGGQAIVNGPASAYAFGLADLLEMRRREAARLMEAGGLLVVFGHPESIVANVGGSEWRSYSWLPDGEDFRWSRDLLPGFGPPGAVLTDADHPFAPVVETLASRLAYRVYLNEDATGVATVFCRSSGGVATGFEVALGEGRAVILPAIHKPEADRQIISETMLRSFERWDAGSRESAVKEAM